MGGMPEAMNLQKRSCLMLFRSGKVLRSGLPSQSYHIRLRWKGLGSWGCGFAGRWGGVFRGGLRGRRGGVEGRWAAHKCVGARQSEFRQSVTGAVVIAERIEGTAV